MKKTSIIFALLAAVLSWSCQQVVVEEASARQGSESLKVLRIQGSPETKTSYAGETDFSWTAGDQVSVLCHDGSNNFFETFTTATGAASAEFTATVPSGVEKGPSSGLKKMALYPADAGHSYSDVGALPSVNYVVPAVRDFRTSKGGHDESAIPMFAWGNDNDVFFFGSMTGAVKFTFSDLTSSEVKFVFTAFKEKMSGTFPLTGLDGSFSNVTWAPVDAAADEEKTISFYADVDPLGQVSFYVPYPTGTLVAGARVLLEAADGSEVIFDRTTLGDIEVKKNRITVVNPVDVHSPKLVHLDQDVRNPERGFTDWTLIEYNGADFPVALDITKDENSLVFVRFNLTGYKTKDLDSYVLNAIKQVLEDVRSQGKKAVVRFCYTTTGKDDASWTWVQSHIASLQPLFESYKDVIYVVHAGFIGKKGEWGGSDNFSETAPSYPNEPSSSSFYQKRGPVIDALLSAVPASRQIALRVPAYKRYYAWYINEVTSCWAWNPITAFGGTDYNSRIAFHNDRFAANVGNGGTFADWATPYGDPNPPGNVDRRMWYSQSAWLVCGGETGGAEAGDNVNPDPVYSTFDKAREAIFDQHLSYLNNLDNRSSTSLRNLTDPDIEELRKSLGYHLWLKDARIYYSDSDPDALAAGKSLTVSCMLENKGAAPVIYQRPMKLLLLDKDDDLQAVLEGDMGDVRLVAPNGGTRNFVARLKIPARGIKPGDKLALYFPDASDTIEDRAVYAIHLANDHLTDDTEWVTISNSTDPANPAQALGGYNVFYTF